MTIALYALGLVLILAGVIGLLLPVLPGAPLIFAGLVSIAWADGFERIGGLGLLVLGVLTLLISIVDYVSSVTGARRFGASVWGIVGAVAGLVMVIPFGFVGLVVGPLAGALLAEYLREPDFRRAARIGVGSLLGFVIGTAVKYALAVFMLGLALTLWVF